MIRLNGKLGSLPRRRRIVRLGRGDTQLAAILGTH